MIHIASAGYISIEKLRYFLSTSFPQMPFEPIAQTLKRNIEQQSGLLNFFDYCTVMDMVAHHEPDVLQLYSTHMWHTLPLICVLCNMGLLALHGWVTDEAMLDGFNAFFVFLYGSMHHDSGA